MRNIHSFVRDLCPKNGETRIYLWKPLEKLNDSENSEDRQEFHISSKLNISTVPAIGNSCKIQDEKFANFHGMSKPAISLDLSCMLGASYACCATRNSADNIECFLTPVDGRRKVKDDCQEKTFLRERDDPQGRISRQQLISGNRWLQNRELTLLSKLSLSNWM